MAAAPPVAAGYPAGAASPAAPVAAGAGSGKVGKVKAPPPPMAEGGRYHYAASNGKWTIGGLSKSNVFSIIVHNGME